MAGSTAFNVKLLLPDIGSGTGVSTPIADSTLVNVYVDLYTRIAGTS